MSAPRSRALIVLLGAVLVLLLGGCGDGSGDGAGSRGSDAAGEGDAAEPEADADDAAAEDDEPSPTPVPEPVPEGELPPIQVTSPVAFAELVGSFTLAGTARVHEGTLAWAILDAELRPMVRGTTTARCGAPCRGRFSTRVSLMNVPLGSWELHVWSPNVADEGPRRLHDTMVPITVTDRRTPGAPDPNAPPPGGVPR